MRLFLLCLLTCAVWNGYGQDSTAYQKLKPRSPRTAAILSACLPGAGQIYNRKYWKAPVVWAAMGIPAWFAVDLSKEHKLYKDAYIARTDGDPATSDDFPLYTDDQLRENVDFYRRYRDMNIFLIALIYTLNIVDASVDAHLSTFNVSNDLSIHLSPPSRQGGTPLLGLRISLNHRP